jgi:Uma2 family endonuclease
MTVLTPPRTNVLRWTRDDFMRIHGQLTSHGRRVELIRGEIWDLGPMNTPHAACVSKSRRHLDTYFGSGWDVRVQLPLDVSRDTMPFPDLLVVPFRHDYYGRAHPTPKDSGLLIEVADTTLDTDLTEKAELYATAGIHEYWILDVANRVLYVLRDPGTVAANGTAYRSQQQLGPDDSVAPLAAPHGSVKVSDLLP